MVFSFYMDILKWESFHRQTCAGLHARVSIRAAEYAPARVACRSRTARLA